MRAVNNLIPRVDRAVVQMHLDSLNAALPPPDLNQMDVEVNATSYTLEQSAEDRVVAKFAELVGHQLPSPTGARLPSIAPSLQAAAIFFGVPLPDAPTGAGDADAQGFDR